jgi:hypothetical protein
MNFITKLKFNVDLLKVEQELATLLETVPWPVQQTINDICYPANQLGAKYRPNAKFPWIDASGSLYDSKLNKFTSREADFTEWNPIGSYTRQVIEELGRTENKTFGRVRFMRLMPKTGLSIHSDFETRYHLSLQTNPGALFGEFTGEEIAAKCYHIPSDGHFYHVDTTRRHFVYNGGWEPRIHLVINEI